ncbi:GDP-L-fucose synthase [soil metagenome]
MKVSPHHKVYVAGHGGMVGGALLRGLRARGFENVVTAGRRELDLTEQSATRDWIADMKPDVTIVAAAKVGGIHANATYPADFIYANLMIAANLVDACFRAGVRRLLFLGSSCIYPKHAPQPMPEDCLLTGPLEETNEAYAIAKIAGLKLCQHYRAQHGALYHSAMPTNLYGPGDNYHLENSHVIPGLIRRFHDAKAAGAPEVVMWGTGTPRREFLYVDDLADACLHLLTECGDEIPDLLNIGFGDDISIRDLGHLVAEVVGYGGTIVQDTTKPDGTPRKLMDNSRLRSLGWAPTVDLRQGLAQSYAAFLADSRSGQARLGSRAEAD